MGFVLDVPMSVSVTAACVGSWWRIHVRGELDAAGADRLKGVAAVLADAGAPGADIDLSEVTFIDTSGWQAVSDARARLQAAGTASRVDGASPVVTRLLDRLHRLGFLATLQ